MDIPPRYLLGPCVPSPRSPLSRYLLHCSSCSGVVNLRDTAYLEDACHHFKTRHENFQPSLTARIRIYYFHKTLRCWACNGLNRAPDQPYYTRQEVEDAWYGMKCESCEMRFDSSWRVLWTVRVFEWVELAKLELKIDRDDLEKWDWYELWQGLGEDDLLTDDPEVTPVVEERLLGFLSQSSGRSE